MSIQPSNIIDRATWTRWRIQAIALKTPVAGVNECKAMFRQFAAEENLEMTIGKGKRPRDSPQL